MQADKNSVAALYASALFAVSGLAACGGSSASLGDQPTLSGQIDGWNRGAGYTLQASAKGGPSMLGAAPIDAEGNFSITLAGHDALVGHLIPIMASSVMSGSLPGCSGKITFDPESIPEATLSLSAVQGTSRLAITYSNDLGVSSEVVAAGYVFVDADASQTGTTDCSNATSRSTTSYDVHLKPGWNRQVTKLKSATSTDLEVQTYTGDAPAEARWHLD